MKKGFFLLMVVIMFLFLSTSCTTQHFGVTYRAIIPPSEFDRTEAAIVEAEKSPGAKYCPEKIANAKELGKKAIETYLSCRTGEALMLLAEARKLAKEAESCQPPPSPPAVPAPPAPAPPAPPPPAPAPPPPPPAPAPPAAPPPPPPAPAPPVPPPPAPAPAPAPPPPPPPKPAPVFDTIYFEPNKSNITPTAAKGLDRNGMILKENPNIKIEIGGHTDGLGTDPASQALSEKRTLSAKKYIQDKYNIPDSRLVTKSYGNTRPVADNKTQEGRSKNRRVEFKIIP